MILRYYGTNKTRKMNVYEQDATKSLSECFLGINLEHIFAIYYQKRFWETSIHKFKMYKTKDNQRAWI